MNKEQLKGKIERRLAALKIAQSDVDKAEQDYAEFVCPHKIGDTLIDKSGIKARLTKISFYSTFGTAYELTGIKIKKNGDDYNHQAQLHEYQGWKELGE